LQIFLVFDLEEVMKGFLMMMVLMGISFAVTSEASAQRQVTFKVVRPVDALKGTAKYCEDTTGKIIKGAGNLIKGAGEILSAPFRAKMYIPQPKLYRWHRGHWHRVPTKPRINFGVPVNPTKLDHNTLQFIPHPVLPVKDILAYEYRF
tara:strand:+ start:1342 stop:1785 length:444 start_codon:yes stop_codon:yes gene_type:complete